MPKKGVYELPGGIEIITREEIGRVQEILRKVDNNELPPSVLDPRTRSPPTTVSEPSSDDDDIPVIRIPKSAPAVLPSRMKVTRHPVGADSNGVRRATVELGEVQNGVVYDLSQLPVTLDKLECIDDPENPGRQQVAVTGRLKDPDSSDATSERNGS